MSNEDGLLEELELVSAYLGYPKREAYVGWDSYVLAGGAVVFCA